MSELDNVENLLELDETPAEPITFDLATVTAITTNGIKLKFDGDTESGGKVYKCNSAMRFQVGDRVKVHKESGSYIVEYVISAPMEDYPIPAGGTQGQFLKKRTGNDYDLEWGSISTEGGLPSGGTQGQILRKKSETDYDAEWQNMAGIPSGGTTGQVLKKKSSTSYDVEWKDSSDVPSPASQSGKFLKSTGTGMEWDAPTAQNGLPTGGMQGQYLVKNSSYTDYSAAWETPPVSGNSSSIGFMGAYATYKKSVSKMSSWGTVTVDECRTKINELLTALTDYGLISS